MVSCHDEALSRRALRSLLPRAHRARRAVCVLRCSALLAAQHRVRGSITAATTSFQTVLHTSTCTDVESSIDVARITMVRCLPHGRFCQLRLPASHTALHACRHRYTPGQCAATCLTSQPQQACQRCDTKRNNVPSAASGITLAARRHTLAAIATRRHTRCHRHRRHTWPPRAHTTFSAATRSLPSLSSRGPTCAQVVLVTDG